MSEIYTVPQLRDTLTPVLSRYVGSFAVQKPAGRLVIPAYEQHTRTSAEQSVSTSVVTLAGSKPTASKFFA